MRVRASTGDEWPGGSEVFQTTFFSGPNSTGRFVAPETPVPLGPRKRGHSPSFAIARPTQNSAKMSAAMQRIGIIVLQCYLIFFAAGARPSWMCGMRSMQDAVVNAVNAVPALMDQFVMIVRFIKNDFCLYAASRWFELGVMLYRFTNKAAILFQCFHMTITCRSTP